MNELKKIVNKDVKAYAFFNNRYAGFAPGIGEALRRSVAQELGYANPHRGISSDVIPAP